MWVPKVEEGGGEVRLAGMGSPKGGAPKPKFRAFFFLARHYFHSSVFPLLGVVSWNLGRVIKAGKLKKCTFGVLGLSREAPAWCSTVMPDGPLLLLASQT